MRRISSAVFVGRAAELAELHAAYVRRSTGLPGTIVVAGEAGVGKTRLLAEFAEEIRLSGGQVLRGASAELGHGVLPYGAFVEALRPLARGLFSSLAGDGAPGGDAHAADHGRLFELVLATLERAADEQPTVVVLEDLHWADTSTRDLFNFLARNHSNERLLLVGSYRTDELHRRHPLRAFLAELERSGVVTALSVNPFSKAEVAAQVRAIVGRESDPEFTSGIFARSQGNPFFTEELVAFDATGLGAGSELSPALRDVLSARVERLSGRALALVRVAAVAGRGVDEQLLGIVSGLDDDTLTEGLRDALANDILIPDPGSAERYAFRHALLREVVYGELLPGERKRLHRSIADGLNTLVERAATERGAVAAEMAHHRYEARQLPDALVASVDAATVAERIYAYPEALAHFERALDIYDEVDNPYELTALDRVALAQRAANAACRSRDERRAVALIQTALSDVQETIDPTRTGLLYAELAQHLGSLGNHDAANAAIREGMRLVPDEPASVARALLLRASAWRALAEGRYGESRELAEKAWAAKRELDARSDGLDQFAFYPNKDPLVIASTFTGDFAGADAYATVRLRAAEAAGNAVGVAAACYEQGFVLQAQLRFDEAIEVLLKGAEIAAQHGLQQSSAGELELSAAEALRRVGRWAEADALSAAVLERGGPNAVEAHELRALLLPAMGRLDEAQAHAAVVGTSGVTESVWRLGYYPALAEIALWRGRFGDARKAVEHGLAVLAKSGDLRWSGELAVRGVRAEADLAEQARAERSPMRVDESSARAEQIVERIQTLASRAQQDHTMFARESDAPVLLARSEWSRLKGESDPDLWSAAGRAWLAIQQPYQFAYALYRQSEALLARRAARDAVMPVFVEARDAARRLGAVPLLAEIDSLGRRARLPLDTKSAKATMPTSAGKDPLGGYGLTAREREVLMLVANGGSDRQIGDALFISDKTVSVHVSNIKGKLAVGTRLEAATLAHRLSRSGDS